MVKKGTIFKGLVLGLTLGAGLYSTANLGSTNYLNNYSQVVFAESTEVTLSNTALKNALLKNLNKDSNYKLKYDDFLKSPLYNLNEETGKIERICLDLSNSNITDISELLQFEFPETLVAIDLSGNNITNENVENIINFLNQNKEIGTYQLTEEKSITIRSDFDTIIKKVHLNNNKINLDELSETQLNNAKLIYGIQNLNPIDDIDGMYLYEEVKDAKYYYRDSGTDNDQLYISTNILNNGTNVCVTNEIVPLFKDLGEYKINIASPPNSESGYFYTCEPFVFEAKVFTIEIRDDYKVERKEMFDLSPADLVINGLIGDYKLDIKDASTNTIGTQNVNIIISHTDDKDITTNRHVTLQFDVVDTTLPTIELTPNNTNVIYWRQYREWEEPGYKGYDSYDDISGFVDVDKSELDITKTGTYQIRYNLTDLAGNKAIEVVRTVIVQAQVLDEITLSTSTKQLFVGKEITLVVKPNENVDISKYKDFVYTWYMDGEFFKTTNGDSITGKSTTSIILDKTTAVDITVELQAKQQVDNKVVVVTSNRLELKPEINQDNTTIIIAAAIAITIVLGVMIGGIIAKHRKTKKITKKKKTIKHQKSNKNQNTTQEEKDNSIQVIKNYNPNDEINKKPKDDQKKNTDNSFFDR